MTPQEMMRKLLVLLVLALTACSDAGYGVTETGTIDECKIVVSEAWGHVIVASPNCHVSVR